VKLESLHPRVTYQCLTNTAIAATPHRGQPSRLVRTRDTTALLARPADFPRSLSRESPIPCARSRSAYASRFVKSEPRPLERCMRSCSRFPMTSNTQGDACAYTGARRWSRHGVCRTMLIFRALRSLNIPRAIQRYLSHGAAGGHASSTPGRRLLESTALPPAHDVISALSSSPQLKTAASLFLITMRNFIRPWRPIYFQSASEIRQADSRPHISRARASRRVKCALISFDSTMRSTCRGRDRHPCYRATPWLPLHHQARGQTLSSIDRDPGDRRCTRRSRDRAGPGWRSALVFAISETARSATRRNVMKQRLAAGRRLAITDSPTASANVGLYVRCGPVFRNS